MIHENQHDQRIRGLHESCRWGVDLPGRCDSELRCDGPGGFSGVRHRAPEFQVLVWVVGMGPEHLAKAEIRGIVIAERKLLVEVVAKPLVDEHSG